ncbi:MAG: hypothetical protein K9G67_07395 [Bacteroidales bacterium]|nr:hypothetical protein [Bacteroidales bacterium]MCF8343621.1 hypothetical protein [Bacteroidales bacterium]MCF8350107.1 hypothetical protein [Bacteroidales bacterium]MCF8376165.1 hypothetical protein [Bacteroidales bacterium]
MESEFQPGKFKDTYRQKLKKVIEAKAKNKEIKTPGKKTKKTASKNLVAQLKESLN